MPDLSAYIALNVKFDLSGTPKLVLTDPNNYPAGVHITGIISVKQPDCITEEGNWTTPDIQWISGDLTVANKLLRPTTTKNYQEGNYVITYTVIADGYTPTTLTKTFYFQFTRPTLKVVPLFDVFTPYLTVEDQTNYAVPNYSIASASNSWSAQVGTLGLIGATNANVFDLKYLSAYYDALYEISYSKTVLYQHNTLAWLSVLIQLGTSFEKAADTPPDMDTLVGYLTDLKTELDAEPVCCSVDCCDGLKARYIYADVILNHIQMRLCAGDTAVQDYVDQFIKLTHNGVTPPYVNTNSPIDPYVLTFCKSDGSGAVVHISIGATDFEPDGVTYLNPLLVYDNWALFWSDLPNYLYISRGQWQYVTGGIKILIPTFDASNPLFVDTKFELSRRVID